MSQPTSGDPIPDTPVEAPAPEVTVVQEPTEDTQAQATADQAQQTAEEAKETADAAADVAVASAQVAEPAAEVAAEAKDKTEGFSERLSNVEDKLAEGFRTLHEKLDTLGRRDTAAETPEDVETELPGEPVATSEETGQPSERRRKRFGR